MRAIAPAKINWTLEVLGKRADAYHEIRSVMQTIDLCDELRAERSDAPKYETIAGLPLTDDDLVVRAAKAIEERVGRALPARIQVEKRIPVGSGLGGGSSDAAAVLRLLNEIHSLRLSDAEIAAVGATVGSDVPFFVYGGTALVEGRGEQVSPLADAPNTWLVIGVPNASLNDKTRTMYGVLKADDLTDGSWADRVVAKLREGAGLKAADGYNVFQTRAYAMFQKPLMKLGDAMLCAGAETFNVAGSGPAIWTSVDSRIDANTLIRKAKAIVIEDFVGMEARLMIARTLGAAEATAVLD